MVSPTKAWLATTKQTLPGVWPGRVEDRQLELAELELVAVDEVLVRRAKELLGVGRVEGGLAAGQLLQVVLAADVARVAVGGEDVAHGQALELLGDLLGRQAGVDDDRLFGGRVGDDVAVDLAVELDLDDPELHVQQIYRTMRRPQALALALRLRM